LGEYHEKDYGLEEREEQQDWVSDKFLEVPYEKIAGVGK
jgi:hypothetical protein